MLRQTEADSKNIFGYYSSQRMKDWQEIVRMYEKDGVYLGMHDAGAGDCKRLPLCS